MICQSVREAILTDCRWRRHRYALKSRLELARELSVKPSACLRIGGGAGNSEVVNFRVRSRNLAGCRRIRVGESAVEDMHFPIGDLADHRHNLLLKSRAQKIGTRGL